MNDLLVSFGFEAAKPVLAWLLLPPLPLLLLALWGTWRLARKHRHGLGLALTGWIGLWAACTPALGEYLITALTRPPPALEPRSLLAASPAQNTAILVLGAGRRLLAAEYGGPDLATLAHERLRYGVWLARQTSLPMAFSGGLSYFDVPGPTEAAIAGLVAQRDYGLALRWTEEQSRDTNENAIYSVALLREQGIERIVLVTHDFHMQRAMAAFERALQHRKGAPIKLVAAALGMPAKGPLGAADFLPTARGLVRTWLALHEWVGWLGGA